jgi:hypothetical protein
LKVEDSKERRVISSQREREDRRKSRGMILPI